MKAIKIHNLSYRYPGRQEYALKNLDFEAEYGQFILIKGPSGCGKSSLCRLINGLIPTYFGGELSGTVEADGLEVASQSVAEMSTHVGLIFQDPEDQIVMSNVEGEIAFGPENLNLEPEEIGKRIKWVTERLHIRHLLRRRTEELSAGEKQKVILASILAMRPKILVLDEPSSQLDAPSRKSLFALLQSLNKDGYTIVIVEHNIEEVAPLADVVFELDKAAPEHVAPAQETKTGKVILKVDDLSASYGGHDVLKKISFTVCAGECLAVTGPNGCGKTTLLRHLNGLMKPQSGWVSVSGLDSKKTPTETLARKVAYLPQNPSDMLFCETAEDELKFTLRHLGIEGDEEAMLRRFGLEDLRDIYPRDLSVGQKQRLALAAVLIADPALVVLDEPTRGIDSEGRAALVSYIRGLLTDGKAIVIATHDRALVDAAATEELSLGGPL
jgi:energy-coupling factor transport system ATP-binding protein